MYYNNQQNRSATKLCITTTTTTTEVFSNRQSSCPLPVRHQNIHILLLIMGLVFTVHCVEVVDCCSPPKGWRALGVSKRVELANIAIVGRVVGIARKKSRYHNAIYNSDMKNIDEGGSYRRSAGLYAVRFLVLCRLKGFDASHHQETVWDFKEDASSQIFVDVSGFGVVPGHCTASRAHLNHTYIVLLHRRRGVNGSEFRVAEVNMQSAAIPFRRRFLRKVARKLSGQLNLDKAHNYRSCLANVLLRDRVSWKTGSKHARNLNVVTGQSENKTRLEASKRATDAQFMKTKMVSVRTSALFSPTERPISATTPVMTAAGPYRSHFAAMLSVCVAVTIYRLLHLT